MEKIDKSLKTRNNKINQVMINAYDTEKTLPKRSI